MAARKKTMALGILAGMLALTSATAFGDTGKDTSASPTKTVQAAPASEPGSVRVIEDKATVSEPIGNTAEELQALTGMELAAENETFALYVNKTKGDIAIKDKRSGFVWFSNPPGRERDPKASPQYKADMASQFVLTYYNDKGQTNNFNSFDDSVSKKQFQIEKEENGIKVTYQLGKITKSFNNIPQAISKKRFEEQILNKITEQAKRDDIAFKFKLDQAKGIYTPYKLQDYVAADLSKTLEEIGYTQEEAAKDNEANGVSMQKAEDTIHFTVVLHYTLNQEGLTVKMPGSELVYPAAYPIASIRLLGYFGAAGPSDQGYMLVPDGSGALINLNSGKLTAEPFNQPIYGPDGAFPTKEQLQVNETSRLPLFGMKRGNRAFIGLIDDGEAMASVTADIAGRNHSYNYIGTSFRIVSMDFYTLTSGTKQSSVSRFEKKPYKGDYTISYRFLNDAQADYIGMAAIYRDELVRKAELKKLIHSGDSPFIVELQGAFRKQKSFIGLPYTSTEALTTYKEAEELLKQLKTQGVNSLALRYVGWFNDGIRHTSPTDIKLEGELGGRQAFDSLVSYAKTNGVGFYPDVALLEMYKKRKQTSLFLDGTIARVYEYDRVTGYQNESSRTHYLLSPAALQTVASRFSEHYRKLGVPGLSLRDLGDEANSDFTPEASINRQAAVDLAKKAAAQLTEKDESLMVTGGNAYLLPYANIIVEAPTRSSGFNLTDQDVPVYQIALHGYFDIAGEPFNMSGGQDPELRMLQALETGASFYYQWFYRDSSLVKNTDFDDLYALHAADWIDSAVAMYRQANPVLKKVRGETITGHRRLANGVTETTFSNGMQITVNTNPYPVLVHGSRIEARNYAAKER